MQNIILFLTVFIFSMGCSPRLTLSPGDNRPLYSVTVGDSEEAALIEQEVDMEIKYLAAQTLIFYPGKGSLDSLENLGYTVKEESPVQTSFRIVKLIAVNNQRMSKRPDANLGKELEDLGIQFINREERYWVIRGSLEALAKIQKNGFRLSAMDGEPQIRGVQIVVPSREDVQLVNERGVDIYSSQPQANGYLIHAGAFDNQIDQLRAEGYQVTSEN